MTVWLFEWLWQLLRVHVPARLSQYKSCLTLNGEVPVSDTLTAFYQLADIFLGRKVLVFWPHLREARVQAISDPFERANVPDCQATKSHNQIAAHTRGVYYWYKGIELNNVDVLFSVEMVGEKGRRFDHPAQVSS